LLEHELYHIGVERDSDGEIVYSDHSGLPQHFDMSRSVTNGGFFATSTRRLTLSLAPQRLTIKRWGASESVKRLVEVAKNPPFVTERDISKCCGKNYKDFHRLF
jgi:hypothetical protein